MSNFHAIFPEEFWTDSDIHISKLSNDEFKKQVDYLAGQLELEHFELDEYVKGHFSAALMKRASYSLPLPEPVSLQSLWAKDLIGIFSKMHSKAFVRSFQLCKEVNSLLNKNVTQFSVRIRRGNLYLLEVLKKEEMRFCRGGIGSRNHWLVKIEDPSSILPFTFDGAGSYWDGKKFLALFSSMKWPFTRIELRLTGTSGMLVKPWMIGANLRFLPILTDLDTLEEIVKETKPKKIKETGKCEDFERLLYMTEHVISDRQLSLELIAKFVQEWRSGDWEYKSETIECCHEETKQALIRAVSGGRTLVHTGSDCTITALLPNPDNIYLVVIITFSYSGERGFSHISFHSNVSSLQRFASIRPNIHPKFMYSIPLDYSDYKGDSENALNAQGVYDVLMTYDRWYFPMILGLDRGSCCCQ